MPINTLDRKNKIIDLQISKIRQRMNREYKGKIVYKLLGTSTVINVTTERRAVTDNYLYKCSKCGRLFEYLHINKGRLLCSNCVCIVTDTKKKYMAPELRTIYDTCKWNRVKKYVNSAELDEESLHRVLIFLEEFIDKLDTMTVNYDYLFDKYKRLKKGRNITKFRQHRFLRGD
jgi:hypothetical protein